MPETVSVDLTLIASLLYRSFVFKSKDVFSILTVMAKAERDRMSDSVKMIILFIAKSNFAQR